MVELDEPLGRANIAAENPASQVISVSARTGANFADWLALLTRWAKRHRAPPDGEARCVLPQGVQAARCAGFLPAMIIASRSSVLT